MTNTNDALAVILQTLGNLNLNQVPVQSNPINNNYNMQRNNQGNRPPRNPTVCFKCRQPGHIARNCPIQQPMNNTVNPTPQPAVQAYAQHIPMQPVTSTTAVSYDATSATATASNSSTEYSNTSK